MQELDPTNKAEISKLMNSTDGLIRQFQNRDSVINLLDMHHSYSELLNIKSYLDALNKGGLKRLLTYIQCDIEVIEKMLDIRLSKQKD
jgi:hypothetical protein